MICKKIHESCDVIQSHDKLSFQFYVRFKRTYNRKDPVLSDILEPLEISFIG